MRRSKRRWRWAGAGGQGCIGWSQDFPRRYNQDFKQQNITKVKIPVGPCVGWSTTMLRRRGDHELLGTAMAFVTYGTSPVARFEENPKDKSLLSLMSASSRKRLKTNINDPETASGATAIPIFQCATCHASRRERTETKVSCADHSRLNRSSSRKFCKAVNCAGQIMF